MVAWLGCILLCLALDFVLVACAADFTLGPETTAYELEGSDFPGRDQYRRRYAFSGSSQGD